MNLKYYLITGGVLLALFLASQGFLYWQIRKLSEENQQLSGQRDIDAKALTSSLQRAETQIVANSKQLEAFARDHHLDIGKIQGDIKSLGARLEAVSSTRVETKTVHHYHTKSDSTSAPSAEVPECPEDGRPIDLHEYTKAKQHKRLSDSNGMRVADVAFDASSPEPWSSTVYGIRFTINTAVGRTSEGTSVLYTELLAESPDAQPGEIFHITGVESRILQVDLPPQFSWWDPHIILNIQLGIGFYPLIDIATAMSLGFTIMSYGDWSFIGLTVGYDPYQNAFFASFIPFMYNVGGPIPFLSDLHLFPWIGINHQAEVSAGIGIGTRL